MKKPVSRPEAARSAKAFVESIVRLKPRLAAFDCDGTLWSGDAGESFFSWEIADGLVPRELAESIEARYQEYKKGKVAEEVMCGEMVTMHAGMIETEVQRAATRFFDLQFVDRIFPEMRELVRRLQLKGCDVWAVSSTNEWVIRAGMRHFGIPRDHILAAAVSITHKRITDRIVRVPSGEGKRQAIREVIRQDPDAAFGNSRWDEEMLAIAGHAVAVNPNVDLETIARERGWMVYFPEGTSR